MATFELPLGEPAENSRSQSCQDHNEMIRADGGDPAGVLDDLAEMKYEELSIDGAPTERGTIVKMPICWLVAERSSTP
jgi:hypothetical protein